MATTLGAGKYVLGENIPQGKYDLKAVSGSGMLQFGEEWMMFGVEKDCAKTYHGLSVSFEITGNVVFEITKATMIEVE